MTQYNIIAENEEYTVVSEYETVYGAPDQYQSEAALEKDFIKTLTEQGYEYLPIHEEKDLVNNLRVQLERLNNYTFTAVLKGITEANFDTNVTATPYITYTMAGETTTVAGPSITACVNDVLN